MYEANSSKILEAIIEVQTEYSDTSFYAILDGSSTYQDEAEEEVYHIL